jgi:MFS family permease
MITQDSHVAVDAPAPAAALPPRKEMKPVYRAAIAVLIGVAFGAILLLPNGGHAHSPWFYPVFAIVVGYIAVKSHRHPIPIVRAEALPESKARSFFMAMAKSAAVASVMMLLVYLALQDDMHMALFWFYLTAMGTDQHYRKRRALKPDFKVLALVALTFILGVALLKDFHLIGQK